MRQATVGGYVRIGDQCGKNHYGTNYGYALYIAMLGVPVIDSYMFGDNQSVLTNSTVPHSQLNKRHNALAYHRVQEAIAAAVMKFFKIDGK